MTTIISRRPPPTMSEVCFHLDTDACTLTRLNSGEPTQTFRVPSTFAFTVSNFEPNSTQLFEFLHVAHQVLRANERVLELTAKHRALEKKHAALYTAFAEFAENVKP